MQSINRLERFCNENYLIAKITIKCDWSYLFVSTDLGFYYRSIRARLCWLGQADVMLCGIVCRVAYAYTVCFFVACNQSTTIVLRFQICFRKQRASNSSAWINSIKTLGNVSVERFLYKPERQAGQILLRISNLSIRKEIYATAGSQEYHLHQQLLRRVRTSKGGSNWYIHP